MRLRQVTFHHVRIPLKRTIRHASFTRTATDSLVVRAEWDGAVGWGEGLPRHYVTGETIDDGWDLIDRVSLAETFGGRDWTFPDLIARCDEFSISPGRDDVRSCFGSSLRCALELSLLDGAFRSAGESFRSLPRFWPDGGAAEPVPSPPRYSAVITVMFQPRAMSQAVAFRAMGLKSFKFKVGAKPGEARFVRHARKLLGRSVSLRIDANEAWRPEDLCDHMARFAAASLDSVEQPIPHKELAALAGTRGTFPIPVMLDESMCSLEDAEAAIRDRTCDLFNIRLSKCGGLLPALRILRAAQGVGIGCQLGCQVGETGILSAAGRQFASFAPGLRWLEGSFDSFLVKERLTRQNLTFGFGGRGRELTGPGLGVDIDEAAVARVTIRSRTIPCS